MKNKLLCKEVSEGLFKENLGIPGVFELDNVFLFTNGEFEFLFINHINLNFKLLVGEKRLIRLMFDKSLNINYVEEVFFNKGNKNILFHYYER